MATGATPPTQEKVEAAIRETLIGWGEEFDIGRKFWWMDWNNMIRDVVTAMRTGEPVAYPGDD